MATGENISFRNFVTVVGLEMRDCEGFPNTYKTLKEETSM